MSNTSAIPFTKLHGNGNDFILVKQENVLGIEPSDLAIKICKKHFGIGSDGLIIIGESSNATTRMYFYNPDGTRDMCGNGMRCVARYLYNQSPFSQLTLEADNGINSIQALENGRVFKVKMDSHHSSKSISCSTSKGQFTASLIHIGTPHVVIDTSQISKEIDIIELGAELEHHSQFSEPVSVDFLTVINHQEISLRIWERGVGETLSCGTASYASVIDAYQKKQIISPCRVRSEGGVLLVEWDGVSELFLSGPAEITFQGEYYLR